MTKMSKECGCGENEICRVEIDVEIDEARRYSATAGSYAAQADFAAGELGFSRCISNNVSYQDAYDLMLAAMVVSSPTRRTKPGPKRKP